MTKIIDITKLPKNFKDDRDFVLLSQEEIEQETQKLIDKLVVTSNSLFKETQQKLFYSKRLWKFAEPELMLNYPQECYIRYMPIKITNPRRPQKMRVTWQKHKTFLKF